MHNGGVRTHASGRTASRCIVAVLAGRNLNRYAIPLFEFSWYNVAWYASKQQKVSTIGHGAKNGNASSRSDDGRGDDN